MNEALTRIVGEARAAVAAGREPEVAALEERLRAAGEGADLNAALRSLQRLVAVHRARTRLGEPAPERPAPARVTPRRSALRTRPTVNANMDIRRVHGAPAPTLEWDAAAGVTAWEVRFSERPDPRRDYELRESRELDPGVTSVALPLGDRPFRVHVLGRGRDGRLLRRAIVSGLTSATWGDKWERRASAA